MTDIMADYNQNPSPAQARAALENLAAQIKAAIDSQSGVHINNVIF